MSKLLDASDQLDQTVKRPKTVASNGSTWQQQVKDLVTSERGILVLIIFFPILLHSPELIGWYNADPLGYTGNVGYNIRSAKFGSPTIDPNIGYTSDALGRRAALDWFSGKIPWWNPYEGVGVPLAGEMQSAAFFPLVLLLVLGNGLLLFHIALQIIAGLATYYLLRQFQMASYLTVIGALLFEVNGTFAWLDNAATNPVAFLPLILLGIERAWSASQTRKSFGWRWIVVGLSLSILAGFPETAYINILLAAAWIILRFFQSTTWDIRKSFTIKISIGFGLGLLLASPLAVAFADYLPLANVGGHASFFATASLQKSGILQMFYPIAYGGIFQNDLFKDLWGSVGGYTSASLFFLAIVSLFSKRDRALRWMLMGWILITWGKTYGIGVITSLVNLLPLVKSSAFFRYAPPSWELAIIILSMMALNDLRERSVTSRQLLLSGILTAVSTLVVPIFFALDALHQFHRSQYALLIGSIILEWSIILIIIAWYSRFPSFRWPPKVVASLIIVMMIVYFSVPTLANPRLSVEYLQGVTYLQSHLGLQRYFSLGPISPNYGSAFGAASINYDDLPISSKWINYVHDHYNVYADPISFIFYDYVPPSFIYDLPAFETVGVKYVVANSWQNPFLYTESPPVLAPLPPIALTNGHVLSGTLVATTNSNQQITQIDLPVTAHDGGTMQAQVCQDSDCATGTATISAAATPQTSANVQFSPPLQLVGTSTTLTYHINYQGSSSVTIPIQGTDAAHAQHLALAGKAVAGGISAMVHYQPTGSYAQKPVYHDSAMSIYELPNPAPYFESPGGACQLQAVNLDAVTAHCDSPSTLIRRSLTMPGWSATVNGQQVPVSDYQSLFQQITLPAGTSQVQFSFLPPHENVALPAWGIALVLFVTSLVISVRRRSPTTSDQSLGQVADDAPRV